MHTHTVRIYVAYNNIIILFINLTFFRPYLSVMYPNSKCPNRQPIHVEVFIKTLNLSMLLLGYAPSSIWKTKSTAYRVYPSVKNPAPATKQILMCDVENLALSNSPKTSLRRARSSSCGDGEDARLFIMFVNH